MDNLLYDDGALYPSGDNKWVCNHCFCEPWDHTPGSFASFSTKDYVDQHVRREYVRLLVTAFARLTFLSEGTISPILWSTWIYSRIRCFLTANVSRGSSVISLNE